MKKLCLPALLVVGSVLGSVSFLGCGGGEQTESGTQVQVSDEQLREAEASSNFMESQSKAKKSKPRKNIDAVEPGRP